MVQVAPVSRNAIVATWLMVTGTSHPLWWPFSTGLGVVCRSHWTLDALTSVSSVGVLTWGQVWLISAVFLVCSGLAYLQFPYLQFLYLHLPSSLLGPTQAVNASVGGRV